MLILRYPYLTPDDPGGGGPPAAEPAPAPAATAKPKLYDQLPKDRKVSEDYYTHDTLDKLLTHAEEADQKLSRAIIRPGKDNNPDEIKAYLEALDIPMTKDGYEIKADGLPIPNPEAFVAGLKENFHKAGLSKTQGSAMFSILSGMFKAGEAARAKAEETAGEAFKTEFLKAYDGDEKKAQTGILLSEHFMSKRLADPEAIKALKEMGAFKSPAVIRAFAKVEELFADPQFIEGQGGNPSAPAGSFGKSYSPAWKNRTGGNSGAS
jgi:hypothetical protein